MSVKITTVLLEKQRLNCRYQRYVPAALEAGNHGFVPISYFYKVARGDTAKLIYEAPVLRNLAYYMQATHRASGMALNADAYRVYANSLIMEYFLYSTIMLYQEGRGTSHKEYIVTRDIKLF